MSATKRKETLEVLNHAHQTTRDWEAAVLKYYSGIRGGSLRTLLVLSLAPHPMPINSVADQLGLSYQTSGKTLDTLARNGFVRIVTSKDDRRIRLATITAKGNKLLDKL